MDANNTKSRAPVVPLHHRRQQHHYRSHLITITYRPLTRDFLYKFSHQQSYQGHARSFNKALVRAKELIDKLEG